MIVQAINEPDFFAKINKIVSYFSRTSKGGFLFCSCDNTALISEIIRIILERSQSKGLKIKVLDVASVDGEGFLRMVKTAAGEKPDGIILSYLDEAIALTKDQIIKDINFSRDILLGLKLPFLFCASTANIAKFANQAQDLFLRRGRGVIHFSSDPGITGSEIQGFMGKLADLGLQDMVDADSINLKVALLEKQLKEAEEKQYKPDRIANEIVLDLISQYVTISRIEEANKLFEKYKSFFNLKDHVKTLMVIGELYLETLRFVDALDMFFKAGKLQKKTNDKTGLRVNFYYIGHTYYKKGDLDKALDYLLKSKELSEQNDETGWWLGLLLMKIGVVYLEKGNLNKLIEYSISAKEIFKKLEYPSVAKAIEKYVKYIEHIIRQTNDIIQAAK